MVRIGVDNGIALRFGTATVAVESEDAAILGRLKRYFGSFAEDLSDSHGPRTVVRVIEEEASEPEEGLIPWSEKGKESFLDLPSGRLVRKTRTGVSISIQEDSWSSVWTMRGPVSHNFSQLVNMVGNAYGLHLMDLGGSMIHASAVCDAAGRTIAVMGQSGMGKSSVAVRLMEQGFDYISNDRVILEPYLTEERVEAHGLPKLPRVNPGTLLDGDKTRFILDPASQNRYSALPREELWKVEEKYDIEVEKVLGRRWVLSGDLRVALVLNWRHGGDGLRLQRLTPSQALTELKLVAKTFGVFDMRLVSRTEAALAETARRVPVYRVTGRPDPAQLARDLAGGRLTELE
jgi:HprK-related kinase B